MDALTVLMGTSGAVGPGDGASRRLGAEDEEERARGVQRPAPPGVVRAAQAGGIRAAWLVDGGAGGQDDRGHDHHQEAAGQGGTHGTAGYHDVRSFGGRGVRRTADQTAGKDQTEEVTADSVVGLPTGSSITNIAPPPGRFSAQRRPSCSATTLCATERPRPRPSPGPFVVKNGLNTRARSSSGTPGPSSATSMRTPSTEGRTRMESVPEPRAADI